MDFIASKWAIWLIGTIASTIGLFISGYMAVSKDSRVAFVTALVFAMAAKLFGLALILAIILGIISWAHAQ